MAQLLAGNGQALEGLPAEYMQGLEMANAPAVTPTNDFQVAAAQPVTPQFDMNLGVG